VTSENTKVRLENTKATLECDQATLECDQATLESNQAKSENTKEMSDNTSATAENTSATAENTKAMAENKKEMLLSLLQDTVMEEPDNSRYYSTVTQLANLAKTPQKTKAALNLRLKSQLERSSQTLNQNSNKTSMSDDSKVSLDV
jgi:hypothetical protein